MCRETTTLNANTSKEKAEGWCGEGPGCRVQAAPVSVMFYFCNTEENMATVKI